MGHMGQTVWLLCVLAFYCLPQKSCWLAEVFVLVYDLESNFTRDEGGSLIQSKCIPNK